MLRILMACHNRRETTVQGLQALGRSLHEASLDHHLYLLDDGSSDGTAEAARQTLAQITVIQGTGDMFWARSMAAAEAQALREAGDGDALLWLNDDVRLDGDALHRAWREHLRHPDAIIVGATRDPQTGATSYSGFRRDGWHPLSFGLVPPDADQVQPIDTFNGNIVLVPLSVQRRVGGIDGEFSHGLADIDYGLRASAAHVPVLLALGTLGTCARNPPLPPLPLLQDWRRFRSPKGGGNPDAVNRFMVKHAPRRRVPARAISVAQWWRRALTSRLLARVRSLR